MEGRRIEADEPEWRRRLRHALFPWSISDEHRVISRLGLWEYFLIIVYMANIVVLATSDGDSIRKYNTKAQTLKILELVFTLVYIFEICVASMAFGWSGMLHPVRLLDSLLVFGNLGVLLLYLAGIDRESTGFTLLSVRCCLRLLRPFLTTTSFPAVRVFVVSVTRSMLELGDVLLLFVLFLLWFGVAGVYQFGGKMRTRCVNSFHSAALMAATSDGGASFFTTTQHIGTNQRLTCVNGTVGRPVFGLPSGTEAAVFYLSPVAVCAVDNETTVGDVGRAVASFAASFSQFHHRTRKDFECGSPYIRSGQFASDLTAALLPDQNPPPSPPSSGSATNATGGAPRVVSRGGRNVTASRTMTLLPPAIAWQPPTVSGPQLHAVITSSLSVHPQDTCGEEQTCTANPTEVLRGYGCPYGYTCGVGENPFGGFLGFDNIAQGLLTLFVSVTLESWYTIMFMARDGTDVIAEIYFGALIVVGAFMVMNLTQVVLTVEYEKAKGAERKRLQTITGTAKESDVESEDGGGGSPAPGSGGGGAEASVWAKVPATAGFFSTVRLAVANNRVHKLMQSVHEQRTKKSLKAEFLARQRMAKQERRRREFDEAQRAVDAELGNTRRVLTPALGSAAVPMTLLQEVGDFPLELPAAGGGGSFRGNNSHYSPRDGPPVSHLSFVAVDNSTKQQEGDPSSPAHSPTSPSSPRTRQRRRLLAGALQNIDEEELFRDVDKIDLQMFTYRLALLEFRHAITQAEAEGRRRKQWFLKLHFYVTWYVVESRWFTFVSTLMALANISAIGTEYYGMPSSHRDVLNNLNYFFAVYFTLELACVLLAKPLLLFLQSSANVLDALIVVLAWVDIIVTLSSGDAATKVLRTTRTLRVSKLLKLFPEVYGWMKVIAEAIKASPMLLFLLMQILFIFSAFAVQTFGGRFCGFGEDGRGAGSVAIAYTNHTTGEELLFEKTVAATACSGLPAANFDDFAHAIVTGFQVLTGDDWSNVLINAMTALNAAATLPFVLYFYVGNYILLSLLIAILLSSGFETEEEQSLERLLADERKRQEDKRRLEAANSVDPASPASPASPVAGNDHEGGADDDDGGEGSELDSVADSDGVEKERQNHAQAQSKFVVLKSGRVRKKTATGRCVDVGFKYFDRSKRWARVATEHIAAQLFMTVVIFVGSCAMAAVDPLAAPDTPAAVALRTIDLAVMVIYCVELVINLHAYGILRRPTSYLRRDWFNVLDFFLVLVSIIGVAVDSLRSNQAIRALKVMAALRPLRLVKRSPGMRLVLSTIIGAIPAMKNVIICTFAIYVIWGVAGVYFFGGRLQICVLADASIQPLLSTAECSRVGGTFLNTGPHFDNLGAAFMALFQISSLEGWSAMMYNVMDTQDAGLPRMRDASFGPAAGYFIPIAAFAGFFLANLFAATLIEAYNKQKRKTTFQNSLFVTREQAAWLGTNHRIARFIPVERRGRSASKDLDDGGAASRRGSIMVPVNGPTGSGFSIFSVTNQGGGEAGADAAAAGAEAATGSALPEELGRVVSSVNTASDQARAHVRSLVRHPFFINANIFVVVLNFIAMAIEHYPQDATLTDALEALNIVFVALFCLEAVLKIVGETRSVYFASRWNRLDFFVAFVSLAFLAAGRWFNPKTISLIRALRVLRLARFTKDIANVDKMIGKIGRATASLAHVFTVIVLVFFIFGVLGMKLFGQVKQGTFTETSGLDAHTNFASIHAAMLAMSRVMTGGNWNDIMYACGVAEPFCEGRLGECGSLSAAYLFFFFYVTVSVFVLRSLLVAVLLDSFASSAVDRCLKKADAELFYHTWRRYDPTESLRIAPYDIIHILRALPPGCPLSLHDKHVRRRVAAELKFLTSLRLRTVNTRVPMHRIVDALCQLAYQVPPPENFSFRHEVEGTLVVDGMRGLARLRSTVSGLHGAMVRELKTASASALRGIRSVAGSPVGDHPDGPPQAWVVVDPPSGDDGDVDAVGAGVAAPTASDDRYKQVAALIIINGVFLKKRQALQKRVLENRIERRVRERLERELGIIITTTRDSAPVTAAAAPAEGDGEEAPQPVESAASCEQTTKDADAADTDVLNAAATTAGTGSFCSPSGKDASDAAGGDGRARGRSRGASMRLAPVLSQQAWAATRVQWTAPTLPADGPEGSVDVERPAAVLVVLQGLAAQATGHTSSARYEPDGPLPSTVAAIADVVCPSAVDVAAAVQDLTPPAAALLAFACQRWFFRAALRREVVRGCEGLAAAMKTSPHSAWLDVDAAADGGERHSSPDRRADTAARLRRLAPAAPSLHDMGHLHRLYEALRGPDAPAAPPHPLAPLVDDHNRAVAEHARKAAELEQPLPAWAGAAGARLDLQRHAAAALQAFAVDMKDVADWAMRQHILAPAMLALSDMVPPDDSGAANLVVALPPAAEAWLQCRLAAMVAGAVASARPDGADLMAVPCLYLPSGEPDATISAHFVSSLQHRDATGRTRTTHVANTATVQRLVACVFQLTKADFAARLRSQIARRVVVAESDRDGATSGPWDHDRTAKVVEAALEAALGLLSVPMAPLAQALQIDPSFYEEGPQPVAATMGMAEACRWACDALPATALLLGWLAQETPHRPPRHRAYSLEQLRMLAESAAGGVCGGIASVLLGTLVRGQSAVRAAKQALGEHVERAMDLAHSHAASALLAAAVADRKRLLLEHPRLEDAHRRLTAAAALADATHQRLAEATASDGDGDVMLHVACALSVGVQDGARGAAALCRWLHTDAPDVPLVPHMGVVGAVPVELQDWDWPLAALESLHAASAVPADGACATASLSGGCETPPQSSGPSAASHCGEVPCALPESESVFGEVQVSDSDSDGPGDGSPRQPVDHRLFSTDATNATGAAEEEPPNPYQRSFDHRDEAVSPSSFRSPRRRSDRLPPTLMALADPAPFVPPRLAAAPPSHAAPARAALPPTALVCRHWVGAAAPLSEALMHPARLRVERVVPSPRGLAPAPPVVLCVLRRTDDQVLAEVPLETARRWVLHAPAIDAFHSRLLQWTVPAPAEAATATHFLCLRAADRAVLADALGTY